MSETSVPMHRTMPRNLIIGLLIPFIYQIGLSLFAYLFPLTLIPPSGWIALHVLTDVLFVACPLVALRQSLKEAGHTLGIRPVTVRVLASQGRAALRSVMGRPNE